MIYLAVIQDLRDLAYDRKTRAVSQEELLIGEVLGGVLSRGGQGRQEVHGPCTLSALL